MKHRHADKVRIAPRTLTAHLALALILILSLIGVAGCSSSRSTDKSGGELNGAMSDKQKATIAEHKKQADDQ